MKEPPMSIKALHILLIICAILLSVFCGIWAFSNAEKTGEGLYRLGTVASIVIAIGLGCYLVLFVKKARALL